MSKKISTDGINELLDKQVWNKIEEFNSSSKKNANKIEDSRNAKY
jgi:hypothetical protein